MADRRQQVLDTLQRAAEPMGVSEIADRLGIHPNTARFHLEALVDDEIAERVPEAPAGRGRPRVGYRARPGLARGGARRYRMLAEILLGQLSTGDDPTAAAASAGRAWGAHLVPRPAPFHTVTSDEAIGRLVTMLDDLDFAPEPVRDDQGTTDRVRLRHCPFLELAEPHRDLVCPVHLGLMQGALGELRAPVQVSALEPFAEPTACLAHLTRPADRRPS
ncbi:helix-turn-helix domain-containing protein [Pseudonocardia sp. RS11V-5]|uniref:helix-turn-helix transcriptional regulator n=1 Tax=Pseudonocardia terrae TaxID=2905831 RepID=UPI001E573747|nr:helix-turn-helix domain-containing protein [Pseudonocardia terrae]MCE3556447.1 helix-turn-helix domain-containing protein [Pseudonocardia terrae]